MHTVIGPKPETRNESLTMKQSVKLPYLERSLGQMVRIAHRKLRHTCSKVWAGTRNHLVANVLDLSLSVVQWSLLRCLAASQPASMAQPKNSHASAYVCKGRRYSAQVE